MHSPEVHTPLKTSTMVENDDWQSTLLATGKLHLAELTPLVDAADPEGQVTSRARLLCAGLGLLGQVTHAALGGARHRAQVGLAAAALSLLTKVDDEVIDRPSFHGGIASNRKELRRRTEAFLSPTLHSIRTGKPANSEPRCHLAADVGRRLHAMASSPARLEHVLTIIAEGWSIQVDAVAVLSSHPGEVSLEEVARTTSRISGAWLLMIAAVGSLPEDAARMLSVAEEAAFFRWGFHIQRADALADFEKDTRDGLVSTYVGKLLWAREADAYWRACSHFDAPTLYSMLVRHRVDEAAFPEGWLQAPSHVVPETGLEQVGRVPALLKWIHGFLSYRYLIHPHCRRVSDESTFARLWRDAGSYTGYLRSPSLPAISLDSSSTLETH